jgi:hypothetical protein
MDADAAARSDSRFARDQDAQPHRMLAAVFLENTWVHVQN